MRDPSLKEQVEDWLAAHLLHFPLTDPLHEAYVYALTSGGRRLRPLLVGMVAESLGKNSVAGAAVAIECFHTASLIVDDLPCMDNALERRGKLPLYKIFGENTALLVSYALIASGYSALTTNAEVLSADSDRSLRLHWGVKAAAEYTGARGIVGGQFLDLYPHSPMTPDFLREVAQKKSASLFALAFVLGWLFGGGDVDKIPWVEQAGCHFGLAFQIVDDLADQEKDAISPKTVNIAVVLGKQVALDWLEKELAGFWQALDRLSLQQTPFKNLVAWLREEA